MNFMFKLFHMKSTYNYVYPESNSLYNYYMINKLYIAREYETLCWCLILFRILAIKWT